MTRRAEQMDETRERITQAAVKLHTTLGPAHTSIARVADEAGVTRLTVYRHFRDADALFEACMGHWAAAHPAPDVEAWLAIGSLEGRARRALGDLYGWYDDVHAELYPIYRDWSAMPESARRAAEGQFAALAEALLAGIDMREDADARIVGAVARHLVGFWTWRSLVVECGLENAEAVEVAVRMLLAAAEPGP